MKAQLIKSEEIGEILVDLTNKNRTTAAVGKQWNIELEPPTVKRIFQSFGLKIEKPILLALYGVNAPNLVCQGNLLSIIFDGKEYSGDNINIETSLTALKTSFQVVLNTKAIVDCKEKQQEQAKAYPVKFTLELRDPEEIDGENVITSQPVQFKVVFREVNTVPHVELSISRSSIEYDDSLGEEEIGQITIKNSSPLNYYPNVDCNLLFTVRDHITGMKCDNIYLKVNDEGTERVEVKDLEKSQSRTYKIMANMPLIDNPISQDQFVYDIIASAKYNHKGQEDAVYQLPDCEDCFTVKRNTTRPQLKVEGLWEGIEEWKYLQCDDAYVHELPCVSYSLESEQFWPCFTLKISNAAKTGAPGVGVVVRNFQCIPSLGEYTEARFARRKTIEQVFKSTEDVSELFKLEHSQSEEVAIVFNESDIKDIYTHRGSHRDYTSFVYFDISFDYWDENARLQLSALPESKVKKYEAKLRVPIYQSASAQ